MGHKGNIIAARLYELGGADSSLRFSPYCWRAKMALNHKGLVFESIPIGYTDIPDIADKSFSSLPVLVDHGQQIGDSFAIAQHLDQDYSHLPPLFEGPAHVAACRLMERWVYAQLHPIILRMIVKDIHSILRDDDQAYFRESRESRLGSSLETAQTGVVPNTTAFRDALDPPRDVLAEQDWLGGGTPMFADHILFGTLMWLNVIAGFLPLLPDDPVTAWFDNCLDLYDGYARGVHKAA